MFIQISTSTTEVVVNCKLFKKEYHYAQEILKLSNRGDFKTLQ